MYSIAPEDTQGKIFDIQRFSIHDGTGIRTNVFLKGCPLSCVWCHNPESIEGAGEIAFYADKCRSCGACCTACPKNCHTIDENALHVFTRTACLRCGVCTEKCVYGALVVIGKTVTAKEALETVKKDEPFYRNSNGGLTISGGEPFFQSEFALALLQLARKGGLHTCVETCGAADFDTIEKAAQWTDIFLYDIKETSEVKHVEYTGFSNQLIIENLEKLDAIGAKIILRCPIIPGLNDNIEHFQKLALLAAKLKNVFQIDIEPYHPLGISKAAAIGKKIRHNDTALPTEEKKNEWAESLRKYTTVPVVIL